jgi:hypothetical protein
MTPLIEFMHLLTLYKRQYKLQVYAKDKKWVKFWKIADRAYRTISFGRGGSLLKDYTTTIGPWIFFPAGWKSQNVSTEDCVTLQHEAEHIRWFHDFGLGNPWLGVPVIGFLYLFFPLPIGAAWFRYAMEREAYLVSIQAWRHYGVKVSGDYYASKIAGPGYLWAWPYKKVAAWFRENVR